jgi:phytoene synthase
MREAGVDPVAFMAQPVFTPALGHVVQRLVGEAEALYTRADSGIAALPLACRPGIGAARLLYSGIGHRVAAAGGNSIDHRAVVPGARKLMALGRAAVMATARGGCVQGPALPAVRHLVMAVANAPAPRPEPNRLIWLLELFAELDSRQAVASTGRSIP